MPKLTDLLEADSYRNKLLDYADRLERGEPWMHKGAKFTKWIKEVVADMRRDAHGAPDGTE